VRPNVVAIFGPTASGKTAVAEALADRLGGEVVSADSMQVYRGLPILTNQPERPTRLVGIWPLDFEASVGEYQPLAHAAIDALVSSGRTPVVTGGTGLYLRAALGELALPPPPEPGRREHWGRLYDRLGPDRAHAVLAEQDRAAAEVVHANDRRRVVRALELAEVGHSLRPESDRLWAAETRHPTVLVGLELPLEELDRRIALRTAEMFQRGVEDEARAALERPLSHTARQVLGLEQLAELPSDQAQAELVRRTRRYARYQRKWMRRISALVAVPAARPSVAMAETIVRLLDDTASARVRAAGHE
jgi:tRNA dimethylallyltransferase